MKTSNPTIESLIEIIEAQAAQIKQLEARIEELEQRLNKNSSNSSKPPSSDGLSKPPRTTSLGENGKNKSGGQAGHKGETLKQTETPDIVKKHRLTTCPDCQHSLLQSPLPLNERNKSKDGHGKRRMTLFMRSILNGKIYTNRYVRDCATPRRSLAALGMTWGVTFIVCLYINAKALNHRTPPEVIWSVRLLPVFIKQSGKLHVYKLC